MIFKRNKSIYSICAFASILFCPKTAFAQTELIQNYKGENSYYLVEKQADLPDVLLQNSGMWKYDKVYGPTAYKTGLHIRTGQEITMGTEIRLKDWNASQVIGAHGEGTLVRFTGSWNGTGGNSYPNLVLSEGARFVISPDAHINFVLKESFYTRQLWAYGDGTGTIEIEEGFLADRTKGGTVEDAMGTIRLNGVNLITHHSRNLPFNTRPDGRGGVYPNGHIVWEGEKGSVWKVETNPHVYRAQLDFFVDGVIDTQTHLVHAGQKSVTSVKMFGGVFTSTGAFRTCAPDVTITKKGPGMLSLEGQQGYYPNSTIAVEEGMLKMSTNPAKGTRYDDKTGPYLSIRAENQSGVLLSAEQTELYKIDMRGQSSLYSFSDSVIHASKGIDIGPQATIEALGTYVADLKVQGMWRGSFGQTVKVKGQLVLEGDLALNTIERSILKTKPEKVVLIEANQVTGTFRGISQGQKVSIASGKAEGRLHYHRDKIEIADVLYKTSKKKKKKKK